MALLNDYDSRWSIQWQRHHQDFDYVEHFLNYYQPLAASNIPVDIISADTPFTVGLDAYRLVIAPALLILTAARARELIQFVESGGHLVLTLRTGMKDEYNALLPLRQPGPLAEAAGVEVEDYYALDEPVPMTGLAGNGTSKIWAERLKVIDPACTQVLATYGPSNGWLDDQPAITNHPYGKGQVTFVGAWLDEPLQHALIDRLTVEAGVYPVFVTPPGVEAGMRVTPAGEEILILINHTSQEVEVPLPWPARDILRDQAIASSLLLPAYEVALMQKPV